MLGGDWAGSTSPLSRKLAGPEHHRWCDAGRRIAVTGAAESTSFDLIAGTLRVQVRRAIAVKGEPAANRESCQTPTEIFRTFLTESGQGRERMMVAVDLPIMLWEIAAGDGASIVVEIQTDVAANGSTGGAPQIESWEAGRGLLMHAPASDARLLLLADEPTALGAMAASGSASGARVSGIGRIRLAVVLAGDEADLARSLDRLGGKGVAGLVAQRDQHARVLRDYGLALTSSDQALDRAVEWAKVDGDAETLLAAGLREPAQRLLRRPPAGDHPDAGLARRWETWVGTPPTAVRGEGETVQALEATTASERAAKVIRQVLDDLWGIAPDAVQGAVALAPALPDGWNGMTLQRLRVGATALTCRMRRQPGRIAVRVTRLVGPPIHITLSLRNQPRVAITVDGIVLGGTRASFDAGGDHEVVFDLPD